MDTKYNRPMVFIGINVPLDVLERIKAEARNRAVHEQRHVPYVEEIRRALADAFPNGADKTCGGTEQMK